MMKENQNAESALGQNLSILITKRMKNQSTTAEGAPGHYLQKVSIEEEAGLLQVQMITNQNTDGRPGQLLRKARFVLTVKLMKQKMMS